MLPVILRSASADVHLKLSGGVIFLRRGDVTSTGGHDIPSLISKICLVFHLPLTSPPVKLSFTSSLSQKI